MTQFWFNLNNRKIIYSQKLESVNVVNQSLLKGNVLYWFEKEIRTCQTNWNKFSQVEFVSS